MEYNDVACKERHIRIDSRLSDHDHKIDKLERSDATNSTKIDNLAKAIGSQTKAIWGLVSTVLVLLGGFFIWYVQSI